MEKGDRVSSQLGSRHSNLKKSFKLGVRSMLTACSQEDFARAFPKFNSAEQKRLYRLYIQVITSLHGNIEDEFESLCQEVQVGPILDTVEELIEEQNLDPLSSDKANVEQVKLEFSQAKKHEIHYLEDLLNKAEDRKHRIQAHMELLKKNTQDVSGTAEFVEKMRSGTANYKNLQ